MRLTCALLLLFASTTTSADEAAYVRALYEHLHANPELSWQEAATARRLAEELRTVGFDVTEQIGGHGIVAVARNGAGATVMLRADMDALPVKERTGLPYASKVEVENEQGVRVGVMHACGHDVHMAVMIGTVRRLMADRSQWQGTLVINFQPAEEVGGGARSMLADGLFERFPRPDFNLALHVSASLPAGQLGYVPGFAMANVDSVDVHVRGIGGHGAYPHLTKDPVVIAAEIVTTLQTIISREISPLESAVITVGSIHGGTKHNVISDGVRLQLTVRSYADETRDFLLRRIEEISRGIAATHGLPDELLPTVSVRDEYTPAVYNHPPLVQRLVPVLRQALGDDQVVQVDPVMAGEDFSRYGRVEPRIPSTLMWLGAVDPDRWAAAQASGEPLPSLHSAEFAPLPGPTLETGVDVLTAAALELLARP